LKFKIRILENLLKQKIDEKNPTENEEIILNEKQLSLKSIEFKLENIVKNNPKLVLNIINENDFTFYEIDVNPKWIKKMEKNTYIYAFIKKKKKFLD
jgi:hypothetical protein